MENKRENLLLDYGVIVNKGGKKTSGGKDYIDPKTGRRIAFRNPEKQIEFISSIRALQKL